MKARILIGCAGLALGCGWALGQSDDTPPGLQLGAHPFFGLEEESGFVANTTQRERVVYSTTVTIAGANWVRLVFGDVLLSGDPARASGSYLRITSNFDGAVQYLDQVHVAEWSNTSAYFNGDSVLVEVIAQPGTGVNYVAVVGAWAGIEGMEGEETICGTVDDRTLSDDPRAARYLPAGCTAWLINDANQCFLSAAHCVSSPGVIEFNVPLSSCAQFSCIQHPPPEDQYSLNVASQQTQANSGIGNDWTYFACDANSNTGLTPYEAQGDTYILAPTVPSPTGAENIRITGYGTTSSPVPPQWYLAQKTHVGPYTEEAGTTLRYRADTTGGNSGSAVLWEEQNLAIGIHTHAGCTTSGGANQGTSLDLPALRLALANPRGLCQGPPPPPEPPVFIASNTQNQIGTLSRTDGRFVPFKASGMQFDGMAYDRDNARFYMTTFAGAQVILHSMDEATGDITQLGVVTGIPRAWGLAYNPNADTLYAINQSGGQLYSINLATRVATPIGFPGGGTIGGIDFDATHNVLYGLSDIAGGTRLVTINTTTGAQTTIGLLGPGIIDCDGLAWVEDGDALFAVDDSQDRLISIDQGTGLATVIGVAQSIIGTGYGMAGGSVPVACAADMSGSSDPNDPAYGVPDGVIDSADFFYFLDRFAAGDLAVADLSGSSDPNDPAYGIADGTLDASDFFFYLDQFVAGCP